MTRFLSLFLALFLATSLVASPVWSKEHKEPLKVIAPDLIVESCEFGKFPHKFAPMDEVPHEKVKFIPTNIAEGFGYSYGYRLVLKTSRKKVHWTHVVGASPGVDPSKAKPRKIQPEKVTGDGIFYFNFPIVAGYGKGKYWIKVWVEDEPLPVMYYTVK